MADYVKLNLANGQKLMAEHLAHVETGIVDARGYADEVATSLVRQADLPIDPRKYGATFDGVTDDTAALRAAFDAIPATGGTIILRGGTAITHRIQVNTKNNVTVIFDHAELRAAATDPATGPADAGVLLGFNACADLTLRNVRLDGNRANIASIASGTSGHGQQVSLILSNCTRVQVDNPRIRNSVHDAIAGSGSKQVTITSPLIQNAGEIGIYFSTGSEDVSIVGGTIKNVGQSGNWGNVVQFRKDCQRINVTGLVADGAYGGVALSEGIHDVTVTGFIGRNLGMPFQVSSAGTVNTRNARIKFVGCEFHAGAAPFAALSSTVDDLDVIGCGFFGAFKQLSFFDRFAGCTVDGFTPGAGASALLLKTGSQVSGSVVRNITGRGVEVQGVDASLYGTRFDTLSDLAIRVVAAGTGFRYANVTFKSVTGSPVWDSSGSAVGDDTLVASDGTRYRLGVAADGSLTTTSL